MTSLIKQDNKNTSDLVESLSKTNFNSNSFVHDDALVQEVLIKAGPASTYQRNDHVHDIATLPHGSDSQEATSLFTRSQYNMDSFEMTTNSLSIINQDPNPLRILKPSSQNVLYKQQVNIRYLQPPTPPPQAPIIIREKQLPQCKQPPIIIRQTEPVAPTPPPLVIREKAPEAPSPGQPTIIERYMPPPPPPPRQVIIERIPAPPAKPRPIIYEKWLPYKQAKRPVIIQKFKAPQAAAPKNVIIEYERPKAIAVRTIVEEGVYRVDPLTYQSSTNYTNGEVRIVDRITDLPIENSRVLESLRQQEHQQHQQQQIDQYQTQEQLMNTGYNTSEIISSFCLPEFNSDDYETITTSVNESLAERIIAEAQASGSHISRCASKSDTFKPHSLNTSTHTHIKTIPVQAI